MRYQISHTTVYQYTQPVRLSSHLLRLRPRSNGIQSLSYFQIEIQPRPRQMSDLLDLEGNACLSLWFSDVRVTTLHIQAMSEVETHCLNPFDFIGDPEAVYSPLDYPRSVVDHLNPYLKPHQSAPMHPQVITLAEILMDKVDGNISHFLTQLTQTIYNDYQYVHRPTGNPQPVGLTLTQKSGSCRDLAVLFIAVCQAAGLAARFVSGYQEGDPNQTHRELHAWAEVYIPGGGWRGFDPTLGLAVADRHISLAAAANPANTAPVSGKLMPGELATSSLTYQIEITLT